MYTMIFAITCVQLAACEPHLSGGVEIAWRWPGANNLRYEFTHINREATPTPSRDFVQTREITRIVSHDASGGDADGPGTEPASSAGLADSAVPVRLGWEAVRFVNDSNFASGIEYDSRIGHHWTRTAHPGIGRLAAVVNQSLVFSIRPDGSIAGITGIEEMIRGMESRMMRWGIWDESVSDELAAVYTPAMMKETSEPLYRFLPDKPVRPGDTHHVQRILALPQVGLLRTNEIHTFIGLVDDGDRAIAKFEVTGHAVWPEPAPAIMERFTVAVNSSSIVGSWRFDVNAGRLLDYEVKVEFLADIIRYDPSMRTGTEVPTRQTIMDRATLLADDHEQEAPGMPRISE